MKATLIVGLLSLASVACQASLKKDYIPAVVDYEVILKSNRELSLLTRRFPIHYDEFAGTYVAAECAVGQEPSFEGFRSFVAQSVGSLHDTARELSIELLVLSRQRIESGNSTTEEDCLNTYMLPDSGEELILAVGFAKAIDFGGLGIGSPFRVSTDEPFDRKVLQWMDKDTSRGKPFLVWFCDASDNC